MPKIEIINRFYGKIILSGEEEMTKIFETLKELGCGEYLEAWRKK